MTRLVMASWLAVATVAGLAGPQTQAPVFRSGTERVRIDVLVLDRNRPVTGLTPADFEIRDNGTVVPALEMATTDGSVAVALALDLGPKTWMQGLQDPTGACDALVDALQPIDTAWFVTFADQVGLKAGPTRNKFAVRRAFTTVEVGVGASMWDAIFGSVGLVSARAGRALVLVLTDGQDFTSYLDERRALEVLKRSDVVVTAIRPHNKPEGFRAIEDATKTTGGRVIDAEKGDRLKAQFVDLLDQFRRGYVLTYRPTGLPEPENGWHRIEVRLKKPRGEVHAREGYYSPGK